VDRGHQRVTWWGKSGHSLIDGDRNRTIILIDGSKAPARTFPPVRAGKVPQVLGAPATLDRAGALRHTEDVRRRHVQDASFLTPRIWLGSLIFFLATTEWTFGKETRR
jgi:hypothetical protein